MVARVDESRAAHAAIALWCANTVFFDSPFEVKTCEYFGLWSNHQNHKEGKGQIDIEKLIVHILTLICPSRVVAAKQPSRATRPVILFESIDAWSRDVVSFFLLIILLSLVLKNTNFSVSGYFYQAEIDRSLQTAVRRDQQVWLRGICSFACLVQHVLLWSKALSFFLWNNTHTHTHTNTYTHIHTHTHTQYIYTTTSIRFCSGVNCSFFGRVLCRRPISCPASVAGELTASAPSSSASRTPLVSLSAEEFTWWQIVMNDEWWMMWR